MTQENFKELVLGKLEQFKLTGYSVHGDYTRKDFMSMDSSARGTTIGCFQLQRKRIIGVFEGKYYSETEVTKRLIFAGWFIDAASDRLVEQNVLHEIAHALVYERIAKWKFGGFILDTRFLYRLLASHNFLMWRWTAYAIGYRFPKLFHGKK